LDQTGDINVRKESRVGVELAFRQCGPG